ncbi:rhodanese-like domain-containing protein [Paenibacillus harenae]|uniref:Rhodanese-related sulfurtransferase n=1 Tax=Paenibacillus harenae TaxID=306543 RepID=A0ABT9TW60_PAEHA|nr:rhodanese-like domain-containing protein [Paenibacillus harenae]MDQ0058228.1 rhodanese-related sulfurtransferase [Paenibacillus harenae]MDQ0111573.1 rhodanese-related sulfurtransferase [Paenibacillus harenae]
MTKWQDVAPEQLLAIMERGEADASQIIDVRETYEWDYYHLDRTTLIPMNTIPGRLDELPSNKPLYIVCAHGVRSEAVCRYLEGQGYSGLHNVSGGMAAIASLRNFQYD